jgi:tetratricopeptide (TPR) repeat protein
MIFFSISYRVTPILMGVFTITALIQPVKANIHNEAINQIAKNITVRIFSDDSKGSGVLIQKKGNEYIVLTAKHIFKKPNTTYNIITNDGRSHEISTGSLRGADKNIDLAIIRFRSDNNYPVAKLGDSQRLTAETDIYLAGFVGQLSTYSFRLGKVSANALNTSEDEGGLIIYSNRGRRGMSGGPILNQSGELVAIHTMGSEIGYSSGIAMHRFLKLAPEMGVTLNVQFPSWSSPISPRADNYFASAYAKYRRSDYQNALSDYNKAIEINLNYTAAYYFRGLIKYGHLGDFNGALADFNRAIEIQPDYAFAYNLRGEIFYNVLGEPQKAFADYNRAIEILPDFAAAHSNLGFLKCKSYKDRSGADAHFNTAINIDSELDHVYYNRAFCWDMHRDPRISEIDNDYSRAITLNPRNYDYYVRRGFLRQERFSIFVVNSGGNIFYRSPSQLALEDYNSAIRLQPSYAGAYYYRGNLKELFLNDIQGAFVDYNTAIRVQPSSSVAHLCRGLVKATNSNNFSGSLGDFNTAIEFEPNWAILYYHRARLKWKKLQDINGALADYNKAIELQPMAAAHFDRAQLRNDHNGALADYNAAISIKSDYINAYFERANLNAFKLNKFDEALTDYNIVIALNPDYPDVYFGRANLNAFKLKNIDAALADYDKAIHLDADFPEAHENRAFLKRYSLNDVNGAVSDFRRAARLYKIRGDTSKYKLMVNYLHEMSAAE